MTPHMLHGGFTADLEFKKKLRDKNKQRVSARSCPACRCVYPMKHEPVADPRRPEEIAATPGPLLPSRTRVKLGEI